MIAAAIALLATSSCQKTVEPNTNNSTGPGAGPGGIPAPSGAATNTTDPKANNSDSETGPDFTLPDENTTTDFKPTPPNPACYGVRDCYPIDLLFVIDNSGTMGEEQKNLARNFEGLIKQLLTLTDGTGRPVVPSINLMVTTTDVGHELCARNQPTGYKPAFGEPVATACTDRIKDFTGRGDNPASKESACTQTCKSNEFLPAPQPFIHFGAEGKSSNVPMDRVIDAINCMGPQGINGCGYEAPLEAMRKALNPKAPWNTGDRPFLRDGAYLGVAIVTDEADCSVKSPTGFEFFTKSEKNQYWEVDPAGNKEVSSAVCWNGGVECDAPNAEGEHQNCRSKESDVLFPVSRYIDQLKGFVQRDKEVVMLGILGVPEVIEHNPKPPFQPVKGGVFDLKYKDWAQDDILPGSSATVKEQQWKFGIGPGCSRQGNGQAVPPVRIKEVCESLNRVDDDGEKQIRCCIESICDDDFSSAMKCLSGLISIIDPPI